MIVKKTIERCGEMAVKLLAGHQKEILEAVENLETDEEGKSEKLKVSLGFTIEPLFSQSFLATFRPVHLDKYDVTGSISFTTGKVSDKVTAVVDERQGDLFAGKDKVKEVVGKELDRATKERGTKK